MYGLNSVKTLGVRIGKELNENLTKAAQTMSQGRYRAFTQSEVARRVLEDFFSGERSFLKDFKNAGRKNVKQSRRRKR